MLKRIPAGDLSEGDFPVRTAGLIFNLYGSCWELRVLRIPENQIAPDSWKQSGRSINPAAVAPMTSMQLISTPIQTLS